MPTTTGTKSSNADAYLWVGATGGSWDSAGNWSDTTTGTNPAPYVPGTLTPVTITVPTGSGFNSTFEAISGGGSAASVGLTGNVSLVGGYAVGGALRIGGWETPSPGPYAFAEPTPGSLALDSGGTITAGEIAIGQAGGDNFSYNGSYIQAPAPLGDAYLSTGATLSTPGALSVNFGDLYDVGGTVDVGGALTIGTAATPTSSVPYTDQSRGQVVVASGGTLTVGGAITDTYGTILVDGAGSKLTVSGMLIGISGTSYGISYGNGTYSGSIAAADGGSVQLGGAVFNAPPPGRSENDPSGLSVDSASTIEIGAAGGAAAGAITVDAGRVITANNGVTLSGALVDNGTVTIAGSSSAQKGDISGNGTVQIGKDAALSLYGTVAATNTIAFLDTGATLFIGSGYSGSFVGGYTFVPYRIDATLTGFQVGDSITLQTPVTAVAYAAGSDGGSGTLTLSNGGATVETLHLAGDFTGKVFSLSSTTYRGVTSATVSLSDGPVGKPVLSSPTLAVAENAASTALGIAAPTDPNYDTGQLTITATGLPNDGTVTLADGITAVVAGQALTSDQLTSLRFKPTPGLFNASSAFTYMVSDPAGNASTAAVTLAIGPALGNPVLSSPTLTVAGNAASTALGIAAPTDPNYATGQLSITATGLPNDGTLTLADGTTAVTAGQALSSDQLTSLRFKPTPGLFNAKSAFAYTVSDPAGNASTAAAALAISLPPTPKAEFDAAYYLQNNPDVAAAKVDPLKHFNQYGWKEGRNPDALFNIRYYLNQNPDVAAAKVNPLTHYETSGWKEGRDPSVNFSTAAYLKANPDVAKARVDPLKHYIENGSREGRMLFAARPHGVGAQDPLVDNAYYFSKYSDVSVSGANPFTHYDTVGWRQGRNPDALFDTNYYLQHNPDVKAAMVDPLLHYERNGWKEGRDPSAQFSTSKYLAANPDVKAAGLNPLVHYEQHGIQEGRAIFHV